MSLLSSRWQKLAFNDVDCRGFAMTISALVTGAAGGIGRATALRFAAAGASVMVCDVNADGGHETVALIAAAGGEAFFHQSDVSRVDEVDALIAETVQACGGLDWAFNNAGILGPLAGITGTEPADFDHVIAVNLRSVYLCMRAQLAVMLPKGRGAIVNTASEAVIKGSAGPAAYTAAKRGVQGLTEQAAFEHARSGVRINSVAPGSIMTPMTRTAMEQIAAAKGGEASASDGAQPNGRMGDPSEIAEAVYWLCSDAASNVVGHMLVVDGGWAIS
jgi:NAD(P)-dependent dehydrogenase (short-subunit alcohol dehydrogenase family)